MTAETATLERVEPTGFQAAVDIACDAERMSELLGPLLDTLTPAAVAETVVRPELVQVKRSRAVVRYDVLGPAEPISLHAKLYADPSRAQHVQRTLRLLGDHVYARTPELDVPRIVGSVQALGMVVLASAPGVALNELDGPAAYHGVREAGHWLAALHTAPILLDRRLDLTLEAANWQSWSKMVADRHPAVAAAAAELAEKLTYAAGCVDLHRSVPIHKDFRRQHVLVGQGVTVVDLDEARMGDAALDIAHFCTYIELWGLRSRVPTAPLRAAFLAAYTSSGEQPSDSRLAFFAAYTWLKIAKQLAVGHGVHPAPDLARRREELTLALQRGLSCLTR